MELALLWLGVLADHYTTREAIKRGAREGNPLGLTWVTVAKPVCAAVLTAGFFFTERGTDAHGAYATAAMILGGFYLALAAWNWRQAR